MEWCRGLTLPSEIPRLTFLWNPGRTTKASTLFRFCLLAATRLPPFKLDFRSTEHPGITLQVADDLAIDLTLHVGSTTSQVTVDATTPLVNTTSSSLGQVIDNRRIVELPLDGREPISLAGLAPGVVPVPPNTNIHQGGAIPSINGAANFTSEVVIDGVPDTTPRNSAIDSFLIYTPTVDAVAEFKVETNSLSAEYGRFNGGVINVVLKSGTNQLHGSVYEFLRNSVMMDANNFFNNRAALPLPALKRNQYGFTLGGPVVLPKLYHGQNRTFFFMDYEGYRESLAATSSFTVPTTLQRAGNFSQTSNTAGQLITIEDHGQFYVTETMKTNARVHRIDQTLLDGLMGPSRKSNRHAARTHSDSCGGADRPRENGKPAEVVFVTRRRLHNRILGETQRTVAWTDNC